MVGFQILIVQSRLEDFRSSLYSRGMNFERVLISDGSELFGLTPAYSKPELRLDCFI